MSVVVCNSYRARLCVAVMRYDPGSCSRGDRYSVEGWWCMNPGECRTVFGGSANYNRYWYFYAEAVDGATWSGPFRSYVSNNAFKICHSDSCTPCRIVGFFERQVTAPNFRLTLT